MSEEKELYEEMQPRQQKARQKSRQKERQPRKRACSVKRKKIKKMRR